MLVTAPPGDPLNPPALDQFLAIDHIGATPRVHLEALDAQHAWPPLLRPGVLTGIEAYRRWEGRVLEECLAPVLLGDGHVGVALGSALCWTERLRAWRPADGALQVLVDKAIPRRDLRWLDAFCRKTEKRSLAALLTRLMNDVPTPWRASSWPAGLTDEALGGPGISRRTAEAALARYLGTRLVASWVAYQGQGLRSVLASLVSAYALTTLAMARNGTGDAPVTLGRLTSALRASDWLLLHLLDREQWAAWCSEWEDEADAAGLVALVADAHAQLDALRWES